MVHFIEKQLGISTGTDNQNGEQKEGRVARNITNTGNIVRYDKSASFSGEGATADEGDILLLYPKDFQELVRQLPHIQQQQVFKSLMTYHAEIMQWQESAENNHQRRENALYGHNKRLVLDNGSLQKQLQQQTKQITSLMEELKTIENHSTQQTNNVREEFAYQALLIQSQREEIDCLSYKNKILQNDLWIKNVELQGKIGDLKNPLVQKDIRGSARQVAQSVQHFSTQTDQLTGDLQQELDSLRRESKRVTVAAEQEKQTLLKRLKELEDETQTQQRLKNDEIAIRQQENKKLRNELISLQKKYGALKETVLSLQSQFVTQDTQYNEQVDRLRKENSELQHQLGNAASVEADKKILQIRLENLDKEHLALSNRHKEVLREKAELEQEQWKAIQGACIVSFANIKKACKRPWWKNIFSNQRKYSLANAEETLNRLSKRSNAREVLGDCLKELQSYILSHSEANKKTLLAAISTAEQGLGACCNKRLNALDEQITEMLNDFEGTTDSDATVIPPTNSASTNKKSIGGMFVNFFITILSPSKWFSSSTPGSH